MMPNKVMSWMDLVHEARSISSTSMKKNAEANVAIYDRRVAELVGRHREPGESEDSRGEWEETGLLTRWGALFWRFRKILTATDHRRDTLRERLDHRVWPLLYLQGALVDDLLRARGVQQ